MSGEVIVFDETSGTGSSVAIKTQRWQVWDQAVQECIDGGKRTQRV